MIGATLTVLFVAAAAFSAASLTYSALEMVKAWPIICRALASLEK